MKLLTKKVFSFFFLLLAVGQSDPIAKKLKLDMLCHLLNVYTKFQIDISKHVEKKSGKLNRTDEQMDGQTLPQHNTIIFQTGV